MIKRTAIFWAVLVMLMLLPTKAGAYDLALDGIYYDLVDGHAVVTNNGSTNCYSGDVVIPDSVTKGDKTYPVTAIGSTAFMLSGNLTHVTLPGTVTAIGNSAFAKCDGLTGIDLPASLKSIGKYAFTMCNLIGVVIPDSVTAISEYAFYACTELQTLTMGKLVTSIGENAFSACFQIDTLIWNARRCFSTGSLMASGINSFVIGYGVEVIPEGIAKNSKITSVIIPNTVTTIGDDAFYGCSRLASVRIGSGVNRIGNVIFSNCGQLTDVTCLAPIPPAVANGLFDSMDCYARATLHVLQESIDAYRSALYWKDFREVIGDVTGDVPGDVNGDGDVTVSDANSVIDVIINGGHNGHTRAPGAGGGFIEDVNGDGEINIADVNMIINFILAN